MLVTRLFATIAATAIAIVATVSPSTATNPPHSCHEVSHTVSGLPGTPGDHEIVGTLCAGPEDTTVQLLVHGATYDRSYWDFPFQPDAYSYVHAMNEAGLATLAIDRLGAGESSHPPSTQITLLSQVEVVHQIAEALRSGAFGQQFTKVVLVGHSLGTLVATVVAVAHPDDVDGFVATGISHGLSPLDAVRFVLATGTHPANTEGGRFSGLDDGYLTTTPGTRASFFYHEPTTDPQVIAIDEAAKDTTTLTELTTISTALISSLGVQAPVLSIMGEYDALFCRPLPCSSPLNLWAVEPVMYPNAASFRQLTVPDAGHNLQLHPGADAVADEVVDWIATEVGLG